MEEKRSWAEKLAVVRAFEASGKPRQEFCRAIGLAPTTLDGWRQRARESQIAHQRLVPLEVKPGGWGAGAGVAIELANGRRIEVRPGFDAETLVQVLAVAERMPRAGGCTRASAAW